MATFTYTYTIANGQKADATPVQQNLNDVRTFMLGSCWHTDGTNGFQQTCIMAQNQKQVMTGATLNTYAWWDTVTLNANNIWQGSLNPGQFKCQSAGFYAISLDDYKLDYPGESAASIGAYGVLHNLTTGISYQTQEVAGFGYGGFSWLLYFALNDIFQFEAYPTANCFVEHAKVGMVQVGR